MFPQKYKRNTGKKKKKNVNINFFLILEVNQRLAKIQSIYSKQWKQLYLSNNELYHILTYLILIPLVIIVAIKPVA